MPLATNMPGFPEIGIIPRFDWASRTFPLQGGLSVINAGPFTPPQSGQFTQTNFSTTTVADKAGRLVMAVPGATANLRALLQPLSQNAPYTIDWAGAFMSIPTSGDAVTFGICLANATPAYRTIMMGGSSANNFLRVSTWTNSSTFSADLVILPAPIAQNPYFLRITDDGTTRSLYYSNNGKDYGLAYSENTNTGVTPTQCGICCFNSSNGTRVGKAVSYHWAVYGGIAGDAP